jgi:hypothetical protein
MTGTDAVRRLLAADCDASGGRAAEREGLDAGLDAALAVDEEGAAVLL